MKKHLLWLLPLVLVFGCKKDNKCPEVNITAPAAEVTTLRDYLTTNNITATEDPRGFFYTINNPGSGDKPTPCSNVTVGYAGKLTNGNQFDAQQSISFPLSDLITGWKEGIPLIATGGSMKLYLPPSLGYGSQARPGIPANSILIFDITLRGFN